MIVALVGNQNCGKSTLFNTLTGSNQKIGNWPGVTIEKKSGIIKGTKHEVIDLPGVYSLYPYSEEEKITRDYVLNEHVDVIVNVLDATNIERSLYLTTQLMELDIPMVLALNMKDLLVKKGIELDVKELKKSLNINIVEISALKNEGIEELKRVIEQNNKNIERKIFNDAIEHRIEEISKTIDVKHKRFYSIRSLEGNNLVEGLKNNYISGIDELIASSRYEYIENIKTNVIKGNNVKESKTDKIDKVLLNKYLAIPIFVLIMFLVYFLSVGVVGNATVELIENFIVNAQDKLEVWLDNINISSWLISLVVDGIVAGVGAVLNFIPQLIILFLCISILETSGYMARISFFFDVLFKKLGLSGKTLIPFIVGSGCSVPGIMSARTIENKDEREMAIILTPFIPCSAKLPIIALFASMFFPSSSGLISASLYFMSILIILMLALLLKRFVYKEENSTFISELPEYRLPNFKYVFKDVFDKVISFIKRAGSVILVASIVLWFLLSFSFKLEYGVDIENSMLASIGKLFSWIFYPILGEFSWAATVSAIQGLVAKEQVVGSMAVIANVSEDSNMIFNSGVFSFFNPVSAYAFVVFNLFSAPCFGAIGAMKKELGSTKKMLCAILLQTIVALVIATLVNVIGNLFI